MKTAVLIGASGLVGSFLLEDLIQSKEIGMIHLFARKSLGREDAKIQEHLGDLLSEEFWTLSQKADLVYVCIGTTKAKTPDLDLYFKIDHGIPLSAAHWATNNGVQRLLVISSMGANPGSGNSYLRIKGKMERDVQSHFPNSVIIRPSMILGDRGEKRFLEGIGQRLFRVAKILIPKRYRGVEAQDIARALYRTSLADKVPSIISSESISAIAQA